jgi:hypothetical protein
MYICYRVIWQRAYEGNRTEIGAANRSPSHHKGVAMLVNRKNRMLNKFQKYILENAVLASNWSDKNRTIDAARNVKDRGNFKSKKRPFVVGLDFHRLHEKAGKVFSGLCPSLTSRIRAPIAHQLSGDSGVFTVAYPFIRFQNDGLCFQIKGKPFVALINIII